MNECTSLVLLAAWSMHVAEMRRLIICKYCWGFTNLVTSVLYSLHLLISTLHAVLCSQVVDGSLTCQKEDLGVQESLESTTRQVYVRKAGQGIVVYFYGSGGQESAFHIWNADSVESNRGLRTDPQTPDSARQAANQCWQTAARAEPTICR